MFHRDQNRIHADEVYVVIHQKQEADLLHALQLPRLRQAFFYSLVECSLEVFGVFILGVNALGAEPCAREIEGLKKHMAAKAAMSITEFFLLMN
jgi:hypothetical protein